MSTNRIDTLAKFLEFVALITEITKTPPDWSRAAKTFEMAGGVPNEDNFWMWRELLRTNQRADLKPVFTAYQPVVFSTEDWVKPEHFVHVSEDDSSKVAYTENADKGRRDLRVKMSVGKYLQKFYGDVLNNEQIKALVNRHKEKNEEGIVHFASTPDECEEVYRTGPGSCMDGAHESAFMQYTGGIFPTRVYGGPDTVIAYTKRDGRINSRCVCNIATNPPKYGRIYGDTLLEARLKDQGFVVSGAVLNGARLLRIPVGGASTLDNKGDNYVMPYLDGDANRVMLSREYVEVGMDGGNPTARSTSAYVTLENTDNYIVCDDCGSRHKPTRSTETHDGRHICPTCRATNYTRAITGVGQTGFVPVTETFRLSYNDHWIHADMEALGITRLTDGDYVLTVNAATATDGRVIRKNNTSYVCTASGDYAPTSTITGNWIVGGTVYDLHLYAPGRAGQAEHPQSLASFLSNFIGSQSDLGVIDQVFRGELHGVVLARLEVLLNEQQRLAA